MLRWRICCIRPLRLNNNSRGKVLQEGALPTLSQVGRTSPGRKDPHPPNLLRRFHTEKALKSYNENTTKTRDVNCFRCFGSGHITSECPTKRIIIFKDNREYTSESYGSEEDEEEEIEVEVMEGGLLMIRRLLGSQLHALTQSQRDNIFHTRCYINGKLCFLIIDSESCTDVASSRLVSKLNLESKPHPRPYKLQCLSEDGELFVNKQVEVCLSMGQYTDKVLCDVVPMEASHILLGRPWQYDTRAIHDGFTNKISFIHNDKKIILKPLFPREVCEDQIKLRERRIQEKGEKSETHKKSGNKKSETLESKINCLVRERVRRRRC